MEIRRRRIAERDSTDDVGNATDTGADKLSEIDTNTYWLTRIVFLRFLGLLYFVAFLVALQQNEGLLGKNGLLPVHLYLNRLREHFKVLNSTATSLSAFSTAPTLLWWIPPAWQDEALTTVAYIGLLLAFLLLVTGSGNAIILTILWALYHCIVAVGQTWYSFGWESQLLETGFLAIFMCPLISINPFTRATPTPLVVVWGYRWLIFRIMLGAGLIKIRGDACWRDLTCMNYHYETQPVPNPLSYYLHQSPELIHKVETLGNHFVELVVPFFIFLPRPFRLFCGIVQVLFQVILILSGNLSFLNWLTILPAIFFFDDKFLQYLFSDWTILKVKGLQHRDKVREKYPMGYYIRQVSSVFLGLLLVYLSIPVIQNLLSSRQVMNTSFDSLRIVNTYGAFGSITKERTEVILQGTLDDTINSHTKWLDIEFKCKPGNISRRPCVISPYHYRLDWLMWFSAFQSYRQNPWLLHLAGKVLAGDPMVQSLVAHNPFSEEPPIFIRAQHYRYWYTKLSSKEAKQGQWWRRKLIGPYFPPVSVSQLKPILEAQGWTWYHPKNDNY